MGSTTKKGEIGEARVLADLVAQGHGVAVPFGHAQPFDLIVVRVDTGALERVQVKYTESDGRAIRAVVRSSSAWVSHAYTADEVDWLAVYDATTDRCMYLPPEVWNGRQDLTLRVTPPLNGQRRGVRWADAYSTLPTATPIGGRPLPSARSRPE